MGRERTRRLSRSHSRRYFCSHVPSTASGTICCFDPHHTTFTAKDFLPLRSQSGPLPRRESPAPQVKQLINLRYYMMPCYTDCSFLHWDLSLTLTNDTEGPVCQLCSDPEMTLLGFLSFSHILRVYLQPRLISAFLFVAEFAFFFYLYLKFLTMA